MITREVPRFAVRSMGLTRSIPGVVLSLLLVPPLIAWISFEEVMLASEFGQQYEEYRRRTWRLVPFLY